MAHDFERYRALFPACKNYVYLNHAGVALPSTRVRDAIVAWTEDVLHHGVAHEERWEGIAGETRAHAARIVGAKPEEIAFVRNTSHGLGLVAEGLDWREGDEVAVCTSLEYPSNVYPWLHLKDRGVVVREIAAVRGGVVPEEVARVITPRTRLVAVSSAQYATGHVTDLASVGEVCRARGVLLCVDGIQTVGALPIDVKACGVHFLSADSHKWMFGINGSGFLFVDESVIDRLRPVLVGWKSTTDAWNFNRSHFELRKDSAKLEEGSPAYTGIHGMGAALALLNEVGVATIAKRHHELLSPLAARLEARGCDVMPGSAERAGILTYTPPPGETTDGEFARLTAKNIVVSNRKGRIRVSPAFFNTEEELALI